MSPELSRVMAALRAEGLAVDSAFVELGSVLYAVKPGDGSAREQAASCQRVLGGLANITQDYATKRYRSNVINWGMVPFQLDGEPGFEVGDYVFVPGIRAAFDGDLSAIDAYIISAVTGSVKQVQLYVADMTAEEREVVKAGCLINYNRAKAGL
jgi:aconitate hydratase